MTKRQTGAPHGAPPRVASAHMAPRAPSCDGSRRSWGWNCERGGAERSHRFTHGHTGSHCGHSSHHTRLGLEAESAPLCSVRCVPLRLLSSECAPSAGAPRPSLAPATPGPRRPAWRRWCMWRAWWGGGGPADRSPPAPCRLQTSGAGLRPSASRSSSSACAQPGRSEEVEERKGAGVDKRDFRCSSWRVMLQEGGGGGEKGKGV